MSPSFGAGPIPKELGGLNELEVLGLGSNELTGERSGDELFGPECRPSTTRDGLGAYFDRG